MSATPMSATLISEQQEKLSQFWTAMRKEGEPDIEVHLTKLLESRFDINSQDQKSGQTLLHRAALLGKFNTIKLLCEKGANVNAIDKMDLTPLHYALKGRNVEVLKELIRCGAQVNARGKDTFTTLHYAARCRVGEVVETLIEHKADINAQNERGNTPLHIAVIAGDADIVEILLKKDCNIIRNKSDKNPFELIQKLTPPASTVTILSKFIVFLIEKEDVVLLKELLKQCAARKCIEKVVNYEFPSSQKLLHDASLLGKVNVISSLCQNGANINDRCNTERTPLHYAVRSGNVEVLKELILCGASVNTRDSNADTALHYAAGYGGVEVFKTLIKYNSDINAQTETGDTPLHIAVRRQDTEKVKILLDKDCKIIENNLQKNPFDYIPELEHSVAVTISREFILFSIKKSDDVLLEKLIQHCIAKKIIGEVLNDKEGSILGLAINNGNIGILKLLLDNGADIEYILNLSAEEAIDASLWFLIYIIENNKIDLLKKLISICRQKNIYSKLFYPSREERPSPLCAAVNAGASEIVELLLHEGSDINARHKEAANPLRLVLAIEDSTKAQEMFEILLKYNPNIDLKDKYQDTSLHCFTHADIWFLKKIFEHYEYKKVNIENKINAKGGEGDTCLHIAVCTNNYERVMLMLHYKPNTNIKNSAGDNPLHVAAIGNHTESLRALLCKKEDINLNINALNGVLDGLSALHLAAINGNIEAMKMLLEHGADINLKSKKNRLTPLLAVFCQSAIKKDPPVNYYDAAKFLLERNASLSAEDFNSVASLPSAGAVEPRIKKLLEDHIREKTKEKEQNIRKEQKKKEAQQKASPEYQIEQLVLESISLNNYTYAILPKAKGEHFLRISSEESFLKNLGIYYLFKRNGVNVVLNREGVILSFNWTEEGKGWLSKNIALFDSEMHKDICNIMSDNQDKILKVFNIEGDLNSNNFSAPRKPGTIEIEYFFRSVSLANKFLCILSKLNLSYRTERKSVTVSYPENFLLDQETCEKQCKIWAESLVPKKETTPTDTTLENPKTIATPKLSLVEENTPSPYLAEIFRLNKACRSSNGLGEKRKGQKSNMPKPKRTALELESNPPKPNSELTRHTKTTKILRPVPNGSLLSEPKLLPTQHQDSNNARLPIKIPTISTPAPDARNSVSCSKDGFFNNTTPQIITRSNRDVRINLATGQEIPVKKIMRSESSTSASAKVSSRKKLNPTEIRAIYYRNIHALLNTLFNIEASDPAFLAAKNKEVYNKSMALRNALVHRFCMESDWTHNEEKATFLLKVEKARSEELVCSHETTNRIFRVQKQFLESHADLVRLMNEELTYLKDAFQPFYENKDDFSTEGQKDVIDACKASVSIIIECYNILCGHNADEIENTLKMDSPELKNLLNECRIKVRNQVMHVCEREVKYSNAEQVAEAYVINLETFYNLLLRLSKLEEFALVTSSESSLSFYPRLG